MATTYYASIDALAEKFNIPIVQARQAAFYNKFKHHDNQAELESFTKWANGMPNSRKLSVTDVKLEYLTRLSNNIKRAKENY